ncbi:MAG: hypothetical protein K2I22_15110 [Lachnospiraceae bacterium]|nr:hypothetical protein [Lachnospiraceae bacterium]
MLKKGRNIFSVFLNIFFLVLYDRDMLRKMKAICGDYKKYPPTENRFYIDDVNEDKCIRLCTQLSPDLILIYGSGILKENTINELGVDIYNIHSSVLPYYRNVHSDFWAFMNKDFERIGISIFKLSSGIDTGNIAMQKVCELSKGAALQEYKAQNLKNINQMLPLFLQDYFEGTIRLIAQDGEKATVSHTPQTKDILQFWKQRKKSHI